MAYGIQIDFITGPGSHEQSYWGKSILRHFDFFKNIVDKEEKWGIILFDWY